MEELPLDDAPHLAPLPALMYYGMRLLPSIRARDLGARALAGLVRAAHGGGLDATLSPERLAAADTLRRDGITPATTVLAPAQVADIIEFLRDKPLVARDGSRFLADAAPPTIRLASYPLGTVLRCPHIVELMNRNDPLQTAASYLGCVPTISGLRIDWASPSNGGPVQVQRFHRDHDDWRFLKLFIYLTDVDENDGPHEFIKSSHRTSGRFRIGHYPEPELDRRYGRESRVKVTGASGTGFMADTWGIHKGNVPTRRQRLLLQIQYSILPVLKFAYRPQHLPLAPQFDRYINRLLFAPPLEPVGYGDLVEERAGD